MIKVIEANHRIYRFDITKGESLSLSTSDSDGNLLAYVTFKVGDQAEYDSYNFSYIGEIKQITEKTVTITAYPGSKYNERNHRLKLENFAWRNFDFNLAETVARNQEVSYSI